MLDYIPAERARTGESRSRACLNFTQALTQRGIH
jgi:hypothetical protein